MTGSEISSLTQDYIAIDTNVFGHLTRTKSGDVNEDRHVHKLLRIPRESNIALLVDDCGRISKEYKHHLQPEKLEANQKTNEAQIIRYWMHLAPREKVSVDQETQLWDKINRIIYEENLGEEIDRTFVYVAFNKGRILISNDRTHIVNRREQLKSSCVGYCPAESDIMTSKEAYGHN